MGFTVGMEQEEMKEARPLEGKRLKAAVDCWFTAKGKPIPHAVQYEDEELQRHIIRKLHVEKTDENLYAGIRLQRFDCSTEIHGIKVHFVLLYHPDNNIWDMVVAE